MSDHFLLSFSPAGWESRFTRSGSPAYAEDDNLGDDYE